MFDMEKFVSGVQDYISRALQPLADRVKALELREPQKGDPGKDGEPGKDGKDGKDGVDGKSVAVNDVRPIIDEAVAARFERWAADVSMPRDGVDGKDGIDGKDGRDGQDGKSISLDDVRPILEAEVAKWALDFERRAQDTLQRAIDKIPAPADGKDGIDGIGFDDMTVVQTDDRNAVIRFVRGDVIKEFALTLPAIIDRGVYKEGELYQRGDAATWGGSLWIAQKETRAKPGEDGWRLAVKKGRDGKDGAK